MNYGCESKTYFEAKVGKESITNEEKRSSTAQAMILLLRSNYDNAC